MVDAVNSRRDQTSRIRLSRLPVTPRKATSAGVLRDAGGCESAGEIAGTLIRRASVLDSMRTPTPFIQKLAVTTRRAPDLVASPLPDVSSEYISCRTNHL